MLHWTASPGSESKGDGEVPCGIGAVATNNHGRQRNGADSLGPYRVLIYSPDPFGLGHLRRCKTIADDLVEQIPRAGSVGGAALITTDGTDWAPRCN